ncbi:MAG: 3'-5' exonuclease [Cyclobacteriaceae bacterium]|nr:3'-5' exonuclease [Cyclobacteriaceae bacterium HetDA_MAG_MS6]
MDSFTAIDFETAQWNPTSICQVGLIRVEDGVITNEIDRLVRPPENYYFYKNIEIHKIQPEDTEDAPSFDVVWQEIRHWIIDQTVVAHNAKFDVTCLRSTLSFYNLPQPAFQEKCTRKIYRRGLSYLSKKYKISLNHHDALSDAHACAQLYLRHLAHEKLPKTGSLFPDY